MLAFADLDPRKAGTIWAVHLGEDLPLVLSECDPLFTRVGRESAEVLAEAMGKGSLPEIIRRFEAGRQCHAAWMDNRIVSYGWVSFDQEMVGEVNLRLNLLMGEAYIWDCATLPAYRRRGLYGSLLSYILRDLAAQQVVCRAWIGTDLANIASQRGIARAGFHHIANLVVERVLALRFVWAQPAPGVPESWVAEARRVYLGNRGNLWLEAVAQAHQV